MGCKGFSACYGYSCGGGAIDQTTIGYPAAGGPHPKCNLPPEMFSFEIGGWKGFLRGAGVMDEIQRQNLGCQHSNCMCSDPQCQCYGTDMAGNTNFNGHMSGEDCQSMGHCKSPDMTIAGCCEDPVTGQNPSVEVGFGTGLNQKECECRGGKWSTWCEPWDQEQLDECDQCKSTCHPFKLMDGDGWNYNRDCEEGNVSVDADGVRCCCPLDRPKCASCPNHCVVWQGVAENTCGPPVLYCPENSACGPRKSENNLGYGVTIPWEITLVCTAPAKAAHGHLADPPDYGAWLLHLVAYRPSEGNILGNDICKEWTFSNTHGYGDLDLGTVCRDGTWEINVDVPVEPDEITTSCSCACPCKQAVSNIGSGQDVCDCTLPNCGPFSGTYCEDGSTEPPSCEAHCMVPVPGCTAMDALWNSLQADDPTQPNHIDKYCNSGSHFDTETGKWTKGELMGTHIFDEENCGICCKECGTFCQDECVCEETSARTGPSSVCGTKTLSYRNAIPHGHGCSRASKPTNQGTAKEGDCCVEDYGIMTGEHTPNTGCIEESYYECGCLSEDEANSGTIQLRIRANAGQSAGPLGTTVTSVGGYEKSDGSGERMNPGESGATPVGSDDEGVIVGECGNLDAVCDASRKHPDTDGCRYTKWPTPDCATPLPPPDYTEGVRCPNSLVFEQPTYGYQCTLKGGSNNGDWSKGAGGCLNARAERWHLRPQYTHPHLWAICPKTGHGEDPGTCNDPFTPADAECAQHPHYENFGHSDLGNIHGNILECNIYCEGWWEVIVDCFRAWQLDLCFACMGDCWYDRKVQGADPFTGGHCDIEDLSNDWGCDGKWPGIFPFLYYHPPEPEFCPYGEFFPAISCPTVPNSPAAATLGKAGQLYYPGNIETKYTSCCGNQPAGCECCYPCGHPAYDPECRVKSLLTGNMCDICWECMCDSSVSEGYNANQVYKSNGCPNGCLSAIDPKATGDCVQVAQDGGALIAGCGQFMQETFSVPEACPAPIFCPEGQIPHSKYGGGYCIEGDFCCQCLKEKGHWEIKGSADLFDGPTTNQLGWKLGAPVTYDMAWYPLKEAVCILEPCGMGHASEYLADAPVQGAPDVLVDYNSIKVSVTIMRPGTSTEVGESVEIYDHQSTGEIIGVTGKGAPIKITSRVQVGQLEINLAPGDPIFIGVMDTQSGPFGSKVGGNLAANGQFRVLAVSGNEFTIALPGGGPVIGDGDWTDGGTWHYYDPNDSWASCTAPDQQCAFDFEFEDEDGTIVGTSPKVLDEALFIECVEEAFSEWSNILESLWSPRSDYTAVDTRHGGWSGNTDLFPGSHNINPGYDPTGGSNEQANSHQLRVRFINLGHEAALNNEVPSNKADRYNVPEWSYASNYPMVGRCVTKLPGGDTAGGVVTENKWENMGLCITNGHCYAKGCSANDMRSTSVQLSSSNKCEEIPHAAGPAGTGIMYNNPKDCLSAKYYACLTHPKNEVMRYTSGEQFGNPVDTDFDGEADKFPAVPLRWYLDPKYVREDIGDEVCCKQVDGYWEQIEGDWSADFGNDEGVFNPGFSELFPCIPKNAGCCQGTVSCVSPGGDPFITPTNTYVPSSCCKEYETKYGQCLGDYNLDGEMDILDHAVPALATLPDGSPHPDAGTTVACDYDCCGFGYAGWCVNRYDFNDVYWSTASCPDCGGPEACDKGTAGRGCTETLPTGGGGSTSGPLQWQETQRVLQSAVGPGRNSISVSLRFPGGNVGDPLERTDCDNATSELFVIGDFIKIGNEYMEITSLNTNTNILSVTRGASIPDADPVSSNRDGHVQGDGIYLWSDNDGGCVAAGSLCKNCSDVAHCVDQDGHLIGDANKGIGYFPIDNRSLYHLCRDSSKLTPWCCPGCFSDGGCWIAGEGGFGSSRGVPIGISSLYSRMDSSEMRITVTEIDNTGNLFVDDGNDRHNPNAIARPEKFTLKTGDTIRIENENMKVVAVRETDHFHASVKGYCTSDVNSQGVPGPFGPTGEKPDCEFDDCNFSPTPTTCRHWYGSSFLPGAGWENCVGEPLGNKSWPDKIVTLYEITVTRGEDGTTAVDHEANEWVRKKYGNIINDCRQCMDNLMGTPYRHEWVGTGGLGPTNPAGSLWRQALWYPKFDWQANIWEAKVEYDVPFRGKTGAACEDWPDKDSCCPRVGQVRVGMVNWHDALRERWADEGKGQCYDCNTGVIIGNQTTFGPNSVELHGECLRYNEDRYNKLLIGSTSDSQADCLALNCRHTLNNCGGVCINNQNQEVLTYTTESDCISNNLIWATWTWGAYVNKDVCSNAGHCWDYRDPPLVPASGNPFSCGYMGDMVCLKKHLGVWVPCIPAAGRPYGLANNMVGVDRNIELGYNNFGWCKGFRPQQTLGNVEPGQDPDDGGGEGCVCKTQGKEGIAGDLYIDSSVKWRPDWVPESDKLGAYSIKRVLMKQIGHMLGLPEGGDVMSPIKGPADNAKPVGGSTYGKLVEMYEPSWWNRGGRNDYWWASGVYAGDFK